MDKYLYGRPCPKCGGKATNDTYQSAANYQLKVGDYVQPVQNPERIMRACWRCKHIWYEAPLDSTGESQ